MIRYAFDLIASRLYVIRGDSMNPNFHQGDHLVVRLLVHPVKYPHRGEVVVVRDLVDPGSAYLKRVVGLPGETVSIEDGLLFVDGDHLPEQYLGGLPASPGVGEAMWTLSLCEYLLLGDNRVNSIDSRHFWPVDVNLIIGRAWVRFWPPRRWGFI